MGMRSNAVVLCVLVSLGGCGGGAQAPSTITPPPATPPVPPAPTPVEISGAVQKGPFLVGTTVLVNRRDERGNSTSATIVSEIEDSIGSFDFVTTESGLVQIIAQGYYFSELTGQISTSTLELKSLYEIGEEAGQTAYVNIMTHLINDRVLTLLAGGQATAADAIAQAEKELIDAFQDALPVPSLTGFTALSVYNTASGSALGNAYLLALSTSFYKYAATKAQEFGTGTDAELTLILNQISDDLEGDGDIDARNFIRDFARAMRSLSPTQIAANLRNRSIVSYPAGLGVPDISQFLNLCAGTFECPWRGGAPLPEATERAAAVAVGGKIYLIGGQTAADDTCNLGGAGGPCAPPPNAYRDVYEFDPIANTWQARAALPVGLQTPHAHALGNKIYVVEDNIIWNDQQPHLGVFEYDPVADTWTSKAPRPTWRRSIVTAAVGGKIYVLGGIGTPDNQPPPSSSWTGEYKSHVEIYDPVTNTWSAGQAAPTPFMGDVSCAVGDKIYVLGSTNAGGAWDSSVLEYDTATHQWSAKAPLAQRVVYRACVTGRGRIHLFGGSSIVSGSAVSTDRVDVYDPLIDLWSSNTYLPTRRYWASVARSEDDIFVIGGRTSGIRPLDVIEILDLEVLEGD